jgi:hypothetical protein
LVGGLLSDNLLRDCGNGAKVDCRGKIEAIA